MSEKLKKPLFSGGECVKDIEYDEIFAALERDASGFIIDTALPHPIAQMSVRAWQYKEDKVDEPFFSYYGRIVLENAAILGKRRSIDIEYLVDCIIEYMQESLECREEGNSLVVTLDPESEIKVSITEVGKGHAIQLEPYTKAYESVTKTTSLVPFTQGKVHSSLFDLATTIDVIIRTIYDLGVSRVDDKYPAISMIEPRKRPDEDFDDDDMVGVVIDEDVYGSFSFDDIGGQKSAVDEMKLLSAALNNSELYKNWGIAPPKGILLYGPPGNGKTILAKAMAAETDARFVYINANDITSMWYGESEEKMAAVFDTAAERHGNTILFFDEIDALVPDRDGAHEATQRTLTVLLQKMDGIAKTDNVLVIGATNRLDALDEAATRAGRFDRKIEIAKPGPDGRAEIFSIAMNEAEKRAGRKLFDLSNTEQIVAASDGMSGADIVEIVRRSLELKIHAEYSGGTPTCVVDSDLIALLKPEQKDVVTDQQQGDYL